jgi:hypothetical protein
MIWTQRSILLVCFPVSFPLQRSAVSVRSLAVQSSMHSSEDPDTLVHYPPTQAVRPTSLLHRATVNPDPSKHFMPRTFPPPLREQFPLGIVEGGLTETPPLQTKRRQLPSPPLQLPPENSRHPSLEYNHTIPTRRAPQIASTDTVLDSEHIPETSEIKITQRRTQQQEAEERDKQRENQRTLQREREWEREREREREREAQRKPQPTRGLPKPPSSFNTPPNTRTSAPNEGFRTPIEDIYEYLGVFPEHSFDEPVIEASSDGTPFTSAEAPQPIPAPDRQKPKSIRVVANEHGREPDCSPRIIPPSNANLVFRVGENIVCFDAHTRLAHLTLKSDRIWTWSTTTDR